MDQPTRTLPARTAALVVAEVLAPLIARGLIVRRRRAVGALAALDADRRAIGLLRRVRNAHGPGPVLLNLAGRRIALVLTSADAREVLSGTPEPFSPATREKRAALSRFEPHGVLISPPPLRPPRRAFNEQALDTGRPVHRRAEALTDRVDAELDAMMDLALASGELRWPEFHRAFARLVRVVVLGDAAAGDEELTELLDALRQDANWGYLIPKRRALRERFLTRLRAYLEQPDPNALAGHGVAAIDQPDALAQALDQVPQWLFAFDAAAIACFAALALLSTHDAERDAARVEAQRSTSVAEERSELPFLRACVLESLRLWPTTPAILRETTRAVECPSGKLPSGTSVLIFAPLFHRDRALHPDADSFAPARWLDDDGGAVREEPDPQIALLPFSDGPGRCPGREVVLLVTSRLMARVLLRADLQLTGRLAGRLQPARALPARALPATLDHFQLGFRVRPAELVDHTHQERTATHEGT